MGEVSFRQTQNRSKMYTSSKQKCAIAFIGVCLLVFGAGIIVCGVLFDYYEPYNHDFVNGISSFEFYYTHYWLGIPLFVLGLLMIFFVCLSFKPLLVLCLLLSFFTLMFSITGIVLEGPKWRQWIAVRRSVLDNDKQESSNGGCKVSRLTWIGSIEDPLSCREIYYATLMQSVIVACSIMGIIMSQIVMFITIKILGLMTQETYDLDKKREYTNAGSSVVIMSDM